MPKLTTFLTVCAALTCGTGFSQPMLNGLAPHRASRQQLISYYGAADNEQKADLKTELHNIISQHKSFSYASLWEHYETTDAHPDNPQRVFDYYSDEVRYFQGDGNAVSGMNKEHVAPQSWWGGGSKYPCYTDLFQVLPSDATANNRKSNLPLGVVTGNVTYSNTRCRVGKATLSGGAGSVFEPCDEYKGDFARIYLYDAVCYQNVTWDSQYKGWAFDTNTYPTLATYIIPMLLEWNRQDPVCDWEILRNERVYAKQDNRNPFIDYPQLAEYIWGDSIDYAWNLQTAVPNTLVIDPVDPIDPIDPVDPVDPIDPVDPGTTVLAFSEDFSSLTVGNNTSTSGSGTAWNGGDNVPTVTAAYQAGGAVKLGTGSKTGSMTTAAIPAEAGDKITVEIDVKGWTTVEGSLDVTLTGAPTQQVSYTATMSSPFETVSLTFDDIPQSNPQLTVATTQKRCFIDALRVYRHVPASEPEELQPGDLDGDRQITVEDIKLLIRHYLGL